MMRSEVDPEGPLAHAAERLDRALARLESRLEGRPPAPPADAPPAIATEVHDALVVELAGARERQRQLAEAAGAASHALGQAMAEVRRTLEEDDRQGVLDLSGPQGVELQPASPEEEAQTDASKSEEEPAA